MGKKIPCKTCLVFSACKNRVIPIKRYMTLRNRTKEFIKSCPMLYKYVFTDPVSVMTIQTRFDRVIRTFKDRLV